MDNETLLRPLELWGGLECTVNRVRDEYQTQLERNGHHERLDDIDRFASLGIKAIRYPILWERHAPNGLENADWSWADERLDALQHADIIPIAGLVHHGSGPKNTSLVDPAFPELLAEYAGAVANRYPWLEFYTPVNEPNTTARFAGLYGVWYPHGTDDCTYIQALLIQCKATVLAMRAIREVNPNAKLVQTDDLGKSYGTDEMQKLVGFYNARRWLSWDLLCGMIDGDHELWHYLTEVAGASPEDVLWFKENPCPPDIIGVNYYITSERWLDHRAERFPADRRGMADGREIADIETARALAVPTAGIAPLLIEAWERYQIPMAVTEAHIDSNRENQLRWLLEIWNGARYAQTKGVDMLGVTVWALLGSYDWNCLVTECRGYYEPGPFDVRGMRPRETAVAHLMRELADGSATTCPVLRGVGWWRLHHRFLCEPVITDQAATYNVNGLPKIPQQPILITGATGTLGSAFARICEHRNISYKLVSRQEMDIANPESVHEVMSTYNPWAVINCSGYVRVDDAENDIDTCIRDNTVGAIVLAGICRQQRIHYTTFSTDMVFDGRFKEPYCESDMPRPANIYGKSKLMAEKGIFEVNGKSLVIRTSSFFGPWDQHNFAVKLINALEKGEEFEAIDDVIISPTYVPHLVNTTLDLIIDGERSVWHLSNETAISWYGFAVKIAERAGLDTSLIKPVKCEDCGLAAKRPKNSALKTGGGVLMPPLDWAIDEFFNTRRHPEEPLENFFAIEVKP